MKWRQNSSVKNKIPLVDYAFIGHPSILNYLILFQVPLPKRFLCHFFIVFLSFFKFNVSINADLRDLSCSDQSRI